MISVPWLGKTNRSGVGVLVHGYLQGEHRPRPRGAAPGMQPSCQSWSLWLQQGMKYLHTRAKHLHVPLAGTCPQKALPNDTALPSWHTVLSLACHQTARDLSLCHLLASPVLKPPFSLGFEVPSHALADFLSKHH